MARRVRTRRTYVTRASGNVERREHFRVGDQLDLADLPVGEHEAERHLELALRRPRHAGVPVDVDEPGGLARPLKFCATASPPLPRTAHPCHRGGVRAYDGVRVEELQQSRRSPSRLAMRNASTTSRWVRRSAGAVVCSSSADCTRRRPRLASWRTAADERPITEPTSSKGTANRSCRTKASRSAGESVSRTTCSAVPTWSARTASCTGSASTSARSASASCSGARPRAGCRGCAAGRGRSARRPWSARRRGSPPRPRRCARAAARPPARRRPPRAPSPASGRPRRAGGCAGPRTPPRAAPGPRDPSWSPCPVDVRRGSVVTLSRLLRLLDLEPHDGRGGVRQPDWVERGDDDDVLAVPESLLERRGRRDWRTCRRSRT